MTEESRIPDDPILWWLLHRGEYAAATARGWDRRSQDGLGLTIKQIAKMAGVPEPGVSARIKEALPGARVGLKYNSGQVVPRSFFNESYAGMFHESGRAELDALADRFGL